MQIAGHYAIVLDDKQHKQREIKCIILTASWERGVFGKGRALVGHGVTVRAGVCVRFKADV